MTSSFYLKKKMASQGNFLKAELDISTKLSNLEERASKLEQEFSGIMIATRDLANMIKRYVDKAETEAKSWDLLESIIEGRNKARDILDHVKIFFNFVLAKMASKHAEITDIKMLWHLIDNEGVKEVFHDVIKSFGFKDDEEDDIKLLLAVTYKLHVDMEREVKINNADSCAVKNKEMSEKTTSVGDNTPGDKSEKSNPSADDIAADHSRAEIDYMSIPIDDDDEVSKAVLSWNVEDSVKNVAKRIIAIVLYTLNVGRAKKNLSIIST